MHRYLRFCFLLLLITSSAAAQSYFPPDNWIDQLNLSGGMPEKLLSARTVVFYDYTLSEKELSSVQEYCQRSGIDAEAYYDRDMLMAGKDITKSFYDVLMKREVANLLFVEKNEGTYRVVITTFNQKETIADAKQPAWSQSNAVLVEVLKGMYRTCANQLKRTNMLINDFPESGITPNPITGRRNEFFAIDLKVDPLAVPKFGDEALDKKLEEIIKNHYPLKYKITEPGLTDKELRKQGLLYVLCIVKTRDAVAKELLGYDMSKSESALVSVTYPDGKQQLKNIPSNTEVYKVYFKHIDSGNVFLGNKWDADVTWDQALMNQLIGFKTEFKLN